MLARKEQTTRTIGKRVSLRCGCSVVVSNMMVHSFAPVKYVAKIVDGVQNRSNFRTRCKQVKVSRVGTD